MENEEQIRIWTERMKGSRRRRRIEFDRYKVSKGCSVCSYNKCADALEFHHSNGDKGFSISRVINSFCNIRVLIKEVLKCIILCSNCHRELHAHLRNEGNQSNLKDLK